MKMELTGCVDLKMTEITKKIGDMWAQESEEVKQVVLFDFIQPQRYQEPYDEEKKEYDKKMEEYKKTHPTGKKSTDPDMPKRPLSAYFLYANEHRDEVKKSNPGSLYLVNAHRRYEDHADCRDAGRNVEGSFGGGQEGLGGSGK